VNRLFYLAFSVGELSASIREIVIGDVVASVCLLLAITLYVMNDS